MPKNAQRNKKQFKTKVRYENVHVKLVFQNCETFAENYFMNLIFPKMALFYVQNAKCSFNVLLGGYLQYFKLVENMV